MYLIAFPVVTPCLFAGWKTRTVEGRMRKKFFLAPDGSSFACRRSGLQHMLREGFPAHAIAEMKAKLSHEGSCYFVHLAVSVQRRSFFDPKAVLGIRYILVRIRIRGSVPLTNSSGINS